MRFEHLSDHAGDQLEQSETQHAEALRSAQRHHEYAAHADTEYRSARRSRPLWKRMFGVSTPEVRQAADEVARAQRQSQLAHDSASQWERKVDQQSAGVAGEQHLAAWLGSSLSDEWSGFSGYTNRRGEADLVLVGPSGVWVVEVKNRNAELYVHGERWTYRKFDNYGNVVKEGLATDGRGRTWGQQASQVAESLTWWLDRNGLDVPVHTAVVLVHQKASVGHCTNPGVDLVTSDPRELWTAATMGNVVEADVRQEVATLIKRDHAHHQRKAQERNSPSRRPQ